MLAAKYGGYLTFGALGGGKESAPGQPTLHQLRQIYRLPQLTPACQVSSSALHPRVSVSTNLLCKSKKQKKRRKVSAITCHTRELLCPAAALFCVELLLRACLTCQQPLHSNEGTFSLKLAASHHSATLIVCRCCHQGAESIADTVAQTIDQPNAIAGKQQHPRMHRQSMCQTARQRRGVHFICFGDAGVRRHWQSCGTQPQPTAAQCSHGGGRA